MSNLPPTGPGRRRAWVTRGEEAQVTLLGDVEEAAARYRYAVAALEATRATLYEAIIAAVAEGIPAARVGRAAGLSRERVRQVVADYSAEGTERGGTGDETNS